MRVDFTSRSEDDRVFHIEKRILEKIDDYEEYAFSTVQDSALKTFFDLSQEFERQRDFYCICVMVPKIFFDVVGVLYLVNQEGVLNMCCHSEDLNCDPPKIAWEMPPVPEHPVARDRCFLVPIKGNLELLSSLPRVPDKGVLGLLEIHSTSSLTGHMKLFFEKYGNRIGFQLHNRIITERNREHLRFIKSLVNDIGHNVIVPNMYFKLFFRRLKGKIDRAKAIGEALKGSLDRAADLRDHSLLREILPLQEELNYINGSMEEQFQQILSHYEQTSLFLETLLRRSHFEAGRYVIEPSPVNFKEKVVRPQLDRYLSRLKERNIGVDDQLGGIPDEEITVVADAGLISQAYANLFSNAVKYTRETRDAQGQSHKFVAIGMQILPDYFGEGREGIKFNVFSTGPPIPPEDVPNLFSEGYRGKNVEEEYGTGHGLLFIKEVVELHGGVAGYEATPLGNNFYFILPR